MKQHRISVDTLRGLEKSKALTEDWAESEAFGAAADEVERLSALVEHWNGVADGLLRTMRAVEAERVA